jgi:hypothetical protein
MDALPLTDQSLPEIDESLAPLGLLGSGGLFFAPAHLTSQRASAANGRCATASFTFAIARSISRTIDTYCLTGKPILCRGCYLPDLAQLA